VQALEDGFHRKRWGEVFPDRGQQVVEIPLLHCPFGYRGAAPRPVVRLWKSLPADRLGGISARPGRHRHHRGRPSGPV